VPGRRHDVDPGRLRVAEAKRQRRDAQRVGREPRRHGDGQAEQRPPPGGARQDGAGHEQGQQQQQPARARAGQVHQRLAPVHEQPQPVAFHRAVQGREQAAGARGGGGLQRVAQDPLQHPLDRQGEGEEHRQPGGRDGAPPLPQPGPGREGAHVDGQRHGAEQVDAE